MRWDGDTRGSGVATGAAFAPGVRKLLDELARDGGVAEDPELHLLPHIERAAAAAGVSVVSTVLKSDGVFDVEMRTPQLSARDRRALAFALIGSFAEGCTSVVERDGAFEVTTGLASEQTHSIPHGHLLRLRVRT